MNAAMKNGMEFLKKKIKFYLSKYEGWYSKDNGRTLNQEKELINKNKT